MRMRTVPGCLPPASGGISGLLLKVCRTGFPSQRKSGRSFDLNDLLASTRNSAPRKSHGRSRESRPHYAVSNRANALNVISHLRVQRMSRYAHRWGRAYGSPGNYCCGFFISAPPKHLFFREIRSLFSAWTFSQFLPRLGDKGLTRGYETLQSHSLRLLARIVEISSHVLTGGYANVA